MYRATFIAAVAVLIVVACSLIASPARAGGSPWLTSPAVAACFSTSTPDADLCFPTRCAHLFNRTSGPSVVPTPQRAGTFGVDYPTFRCVIDTVYEYASVPLGQACKRARCQCRFGAPATSCIPDQFMNCAGHSCPPS